MKILFVMLHPGFVRYYEDALDALARHLETHLDIDRLLALAAPVR